MFLGFHLPPEELLLSKCCVSIYLQGNSSTTKEVSTNGTITTVKPNSNNTTAALSWKNVMNIFNVFDFRVSFALIRENLGTLLSVSKEL